MEQKSLIFREQLLGIEKEIQKSITELVQKLGGKVCIRHYQEWNPDHYRNAFFDIDCEGHGFELYLDTVVYSPENGVRVLLHDSEDCQEPVWDLKVDFNTSNSYYLLDELEQVANYIEANGEEVVTEYDPDYVPENW